MSKFSEEINVAGRDLKETVEKLLNDATVDRLKIVNRSTGKTLVNIPAVVGLPTLLLFHIWSLIGAAVMYMADYTIVIERNVPVAEAEPVIVTPPPAAKSAEPEPHIEDEIRVGETVDVVPEKEIDDPFEEVAAELVEEPDFDRCQGTTKSGSQCKRSPMEDSAFCYAHRPE